MNESEKTKRIGLIVWAVISVSFFAALTIVAIYPK